MFVSVNTGSSVITGLQQNSPNGTTLVLSWDPPANPNGNIQSYSVIITNLKDGSAVRQEMVTMNVTSILVANLGKILIYSL